MARGLLAQRLIRHKNAKVGYQAVFWLSGSGLTWSTRMTIPWAMVTSPPPRGSTMV
jgi:hypothetical protein